MRASGPRCSERTLGVLPGGSRRDIKNQISTPNITDSAACPCPRHRGPGASLPLVTDPPGTRRRLVWGWGTEMQPCKGAATTEAERDLGPQVGTAPAPNVPPPSADGCGRLGAVWTAAEVVGEWTAVGAVWTVWTGVDRPRRLSLVSPAPPPAARCAALSLTSEPGPALAWWSVAPRVPWVPRPAPCGGPPVQRWQQQVLSALRLLPVTGPRGPAEPPAPLALSVVGVGGCLQQLPWTWPWCRRDGRWAPLSSGGGCVSVGHRAVCPPRALGGTRGPGRSPRCPVLREPRRFVPAHCLVRGTCARSRRHGPCGGRHPTSVSA